MKVISKYLAINFAKLLTKKKSLELDLARKYLVKKFLKSLSLMLFVHFLKRLNQRLPKGKFRPEH